MFVFIFRVGQEDQDKEVKDRIRVGNEEHKTGYNNASFTNSNGNLLERQDTGMHTAITGGLNVKSHKH